MSSREIETLLREFGAGLVFVVVALQAVGVPLPGTTALVVAALAAASGHGPAIEWVIVAGALGAVCGSGCGYLIGRRGGEPLLLAAARRLRVEPRRVRRLRASLAAGGGAWLVPARFITGGRNLAGLLAGAAGMPVRRFLGWTVAGAVAWATVSSLEYYLFGRALAGADLWVQASLAAVWLGWMVVGFRLLRQRWAEVQESPT